MAITKDKKQTIREKLLNDFKASESAVFVNFHGLGVADTTELRSVLRGKGVTYYVAKKTLIKRALDEVGVEGTQPVLEGEIAVVFGTDPVAPAQEIYSFAKKFKENLQMVGGVLEGRYLAKEEALALAQLPGQHELRGMLVNVMYAPVSGFACAINGTVGNFVRVLDQINKTKQA
ncbi:MAG: 50S ribosomal protein L10 [bacterium]|nr:50S ribosomal protein L10 [bacterium]